MGTWETVKDVARGIGSTAASVVTGGASDALGGVVSLVGKVADKIGMDQNTKAKLIMEIAQADVQDMDIRFRDIRESGWLSRQVRPIIALTFHGFFWWAYIKDPDFKQKIATVICTIQLGDYKLDVSLGLMYFIILLFYFLSKMIKDFFITKKPWG